MWQKIPGFDYEISQLGEIRRNGRILKHAIHDRGLGYPVVTLSRKGIRYRKYVHILVAKAYLSNPDQLPIVNHKDGNTLNPNLSNLEWTSVAGNTLHAYENGLNSKANKCELISPDGSRKTYHSMRALSKALGKSSGWLIETVRRKGKVINHKGYQIKVGG